MPATREFVWVQKHTEDEIKALKDSGVGKRRYKKYGASVPYSAKNMEKAVKKWKDDWFGREDPAHGKLGTQSAYKVSYLLMILLS